MRVPVLLALAAVTLAGCDSPYGTDFSKQAADNSAVSTGSHIRGATTSSSATTASGDAVDTATHSSAANRSTLGH
jgi:hypothetical protein